MNRSTAVFRLSLLATVLAVIVLLFGAYTRLSESGLGCPDWPGCYGHLNVNHVANAVGEPGLPATMTDMNKAWIEMIHRYLAGFLGFLILGLALVAWVKRKQNNNAVILPMVLVALVVFQAVLGMWTVTLQLWPLVVMGHLLTGLTLLMLLWWYLLKSANAFYFSPVPVAVKKLRPWAIWGLVIVIAQVILGGWTSANYAALVCPSFPFCGLATTSVWDFGHAFNFWQPLGSNYQGGALEMSARVTIHMSHRFGALIVGIYLTLLSLVLMFNGRRLVYRLLGFSVLMVLAAQMILGVMNIEWMLPLPIALAHNAMAALLLITLITLIFALSRPVEGEFLNGRS